MGGRDKVKISRNFFNYWNFFSLTNNNNNNSAFICLAGHSKF